MTCWVSPARVVIACGASKFWIAPKMTRSTAATREIGSSTRTTPRTRSAQKLPTRPAFSDRARLRANAAATAMPTAAETKFCTVSPDIWKRCPVAASPEYHCQFVFVTNETAVFHAPSLGRAGMPIESGRCCCSRPKPNRTSTPTSEKPSTDVSVAAPVLVGVGVDAQHAVRRPLDGEVPRRGVDGSQVAPQERHGHGEQRDQETDLAEGGAGVAHRPSLRSMTPASSATDAKNATVRIR